MTQSGNKLMPVQQVVSSAFLYSVNKALANEQVSIKWKVFFLITSKILNLIIDRSLAGVVEYHTKALTRLGFP